MAKGHSGLPTAIPGGGGGAGGEGPWSVGPDVKEADTLKEALGTKGRPIGIEAAVKGANPYWDASYEYREFTENCQRAVIAFEARRRGYDVTARPTFEGDILPRHAFTSSDGSHYGHWMGAFQHARSISVGGKNGDAVHQNIVKQMDGFGKKARAIVAVQWKSGGGHVFNVEKANGRLYYVDAQVGARYNASDVFNAVKPGSVSLVRTDNLRFSERAKKSIEQRGRRH